jgi:hypothetical protein
VIEVLGLALAGVTAWTVAALAVGLVLAGIIRLRDRGGRP